MFAYRKPAYFAIASAIPCGIGGTPSTTTFGGTGTVRSWAPAAHGAAARSAAQTKCRIGGFLERDSAGEVLFDYSARRQSLVPRRSSRVPGPVSPRVRAFVTAFVPRLPSVLRRYYV